jgi:hypothetical protein
MQETCLGAPRPRSRSPHRGLHSSTSSANTDLLIRSHTIDPEVFYGCLMSDPFEESVDVFKVFFGEVAHKDVQVGLLLECIQFVDVDADSRQRFPPRPPLQA